MAWRPDLACFHSHIAALQAGWESGAAVALILEDDAILPPSAAMLRQGLEEAGIHEDWDVFMLGYTHFDLLSDGAVRSAKVLRALGGTAYMVRRDYLPVMLSWLRQGVVLLEELNDPTRFALDTWWVALQQQHRWVASVPPLAYQASTWSNIEFQFKNRREATRGWIQESQACPQCLPMWTGYPSQCFCDGCIVRRRWVRFPHPRHVVVSQEMWQ